MSVVEINQFNLNSATLNKHKDSISNNTHWHKIIVEDVEGLERDMVLKTIMKFCYPLHFIPVRYKSVRNTATFLIKNCAPSLERIIHKNLIIPNEYNKNKPFRISIQLCFASANDLKINIQDNVMTVLNKKFNKKTGMLDLGNFGKDLDLEEYCPLSQPKLLFYILHLAKDIPFKSLVLSSNDIESLKPLEALIDTKTLKSLDLRHNNINSISELNCLRDLKLTELWLDGNPLFADLNEHTYATTLKEILPTIQKVDNVDINQKIGLLMPLHDFLCSRNGFDLVDQFLEHYFTLYDSQKRLVLSNVYHKNALFSLTSTFLRAQSTSLTARMSKYNKYSRNLLSLSDLSKNTEFLFQGNYEILKVLTSLPRTEHDTLNCTVDLIMHTKNSAIIVVTGIFREISDNLLEANRLLGFTRTFVLLAGENNEYYIVNDMMHISNATTNQANTAFKQINVPDARYIYIPKPRTPKEMNEMAITLKTITGLNMEWSHRCLEECQYDLKKAITLFVDLFKIDKIRSSAFDSLPDEDINFIKNKGNSEKTNIKAILNESHQYGITEKFNIKPAPLPSTPINNITSAVHNINRPPVQNINRQPVPNLIRPTVPKVIRPTVPKAIRQAGPNAIRPGILNATSSTSPNIIGSAIPNVIIAAVPTIIQYRPTGQLPPPGPVLPAMMGSQKFERPPTHITHISHPILGNIPLTQSLGNVIQIPLQNQQQAQKKPTRWT